MALGIYKHGQGYWVRVMTAFGIGVMILAACAWAWQQVSAIPIPKPTWDLKVAGVMGGVDVGGPVDLLLTSPSQEVVGSATIEAYEGYGDGSGLITIGQIQMTGDNDPASASRLRIGDATVIVESAKGIQAFETIYLQAGVVAVLVLIGASMTYWLVGIKRGTAEFLIATDGEMRKVNWSTRKDIIGSTKVVIGASFLIAAGLFGVDFLFSRLMTLVGVLQQ